MHLVHVVSWFHTIVLLTQGCTDLRLQLDSHTWFWSVQLHQKKPLAHNAPRNPLLGKQLLCHLLVQAKGEISYFLNIYIS